MKRLDTVLLYTLLCTLVGPVRTDAGAAVCRPQQSAEILYQPRADADVPRVADIAYLDVEGQSCGRARQEYTDSGAVSWEYGPDDTLAFYYVHENDAGGSEPARQYYAATGELLFTETWADGRSQYSSADGTPLSSCEIARRLPALPAHASGPDVCRGDIAAP